VPVITPSSDLIGAERMTEIRESEAPVLVIRPTKGWVRLGLAELWRYRELLGFLTWRDILIRYKQAVLGVAWALLQPFLTMVVFTVIFSYVMKPSTSSSGDPYAVTTYVALLPWLLFASGTQRAGTSLVGNANLLTKVYFPRLVIPLSAVLGGLVDFAISFVVLFGLMAFYHIAPTWNVLFLPLFIALTVVTAFAVSLWLSALNVLYRDVQYIIPFMIQLWMYLSPVIWSVSSLPESWQRVVYLNPMTGVIQAFRWSLLGQTRPSGLVLISTGAVLVILVGGLFYFRRMERVFADVV
jgi:lipopolysaccharide transport system permease protein